SDAERVPAVQHHPPPMGNATTCLPALKSGLVSSCHSLPPMRENCEWQDDWFQVVFPLAGLRLQQYVQLQERAPGIPAMRPVPEYAAALPRLRQVRQESQTPA